MNEDLDDQIFTLFSTMKMRQQLSVCRDGVHWEECEFLAFHHHGYPSSRTVNVQFLSSNKTTYFEITGGIQDVLLKIRALEKKEPKKQEQYRHLF